jgi:hypothetical protein
VCFRKYLHAYYDSKMKIFYYEIGMMIHYKFIPLDQSLLGDTKRLQRIKMSKREGELG